MSSVPHRIKVDNTSDLVRFHEYQDLLMNAPIGIFTYSPQGNYLSANLALARILGYAAPEELMNSIMDIKTQVFFDHEDEEVLKNILETNPCVTNHECRLLRRDGSKFWASMNVRAVRDLDGNIVCYQVFTIDITERKELEENLTYLCYHDQLTGLYNRTCFENEMKRLNKSREYPIAIISVDVDGLKIVNDTLGHDFGDRMLKLCAHLLKQSLRESDILARVGGDEFAALLPRTNKETSNDIIQRIRGAIIQSNENIRKNKIPLTISLGIGVAVDDSRDLVTVLQDADNHMYLDKLSKNESYLSQVMRSLLSALGERDLINHGNGKRLENICRLFGKKIGLSESELSDLELLALLHDIGNVSIPDTILFKEGPLTDNEWQIIFQHPEKGYRIAKAVPDLEKIGDLILKHHERWDGKGYPLGLRGEDIPVECRILAIADAYDAMTADRPYRKAMSSAKARETIKKGSRTRFDPQLVDIFLGIKDIDDPKG